MPKTISKKSAAPKDETINLPVIGKGTFQNKKIYLVIIVIALLLLAFYKKSWFIAATVNSQPITNLEVMKKMNAQFRTQVLNQMINEKIVIDEAKKNNISVSKSDVDNKIAELEKNVGGPQALDNLLTQQGQTRAALRDQLNIQIMIEKLYANDATTSAEEVSKFIEENKAQLQSTTSAEQTKEATEILKQQKLSKIFSQKFQELKQKAKITIF